jgi:hypothetical protein
VNVPTLDVSKVGVVTVKNFAPHVPHVTKGAATDWHLNAMACVANLCATTKTVGWLQAHGTHAAVAELLCNFCENRCRLAVYLNVELNC